MKLTRVLTAAAFVLAAGGSSAAPVTFDLQKPYGTYIPLQSSFSLTEGDLTATFSGKAYKGSSRSGGVISGGEVKNGWIGRYYGGAGVTNSRNDGSHTVDGSGWDDFIQISFSKVVKISSISFGYYDRKDDFRFLTDGNGDGSIGLNDNYSASYKVWKNNPFSGFGGLMTDIFAVGAFGSNDSWKLKSVTVDYEPAAVPLPAAGWLLLGAIGGLGVMRRRKKV